MTMQSFLKASKAHLRGPTNPSICWTKRPINQMKQKRVYRVFSQMTVAGSSPKHKLKMLPENRRSAILPRGVCT